jgi:hypothetical protein
MLAASFISKHMHDVAFWHITSFAATHHFWSLLDQSGQRRIFSRDGSVANDPSVTSGREREFKPVR